MYHIVLTQSYGMTIAPAQQVLRLYLYKYDLPSKKHNLCIVHIHQNSRFFF